MDELDRLMDKVLGPTTAAFCRREMPWLQGDDYAPFLPDMALVEKLATYLSGLPKELSDMAIAFGILRLLYDLGIELPVHHIRRNDEGPPRQRATVPAADDTKVAPERLLGGGPDAGGTMEP